MNFSSINFVFLTMLKVREEQIHFWFCWCFPPTGPMHLISALSLWTGTLGTEHGGVLQLSDSTKWRTWIYEHKHTEQVTANTALRTAGKMKNMGDTISRGVDVKVRTWIKWRTWRMNTVRSLVKKTSNIEPSPKGKISSYPYLSFPYSLFSLIIYFH